MQPSTWFNNKNVRINPYVFFSSAGLALLLVICSVLFSETTTAMFSTVQGWILQNAGWFYILSVGLFLLFVVILALSDFGRIKLGPDHSVPDYSYSSWFAMLFSAGMGIGLMFFGVAEPVMHYASPPVGDAQSLDAARQAMKITFFHWGMHAWAIYAVVALSLAYFAFRHNLPLSIRSALYPLIGERIYGPAGHAGDTFAVLGTLFGVATSLGFGVLQVNAGLNYLFDIPQTVTVQVVLIIVITLIATLSVAMGLDGGIRRVSELNLLLAVALLLFVLVAGPTVYLLQTFVQNTGSYLSELVHMTFNQYAYEPTRWLGGWTLFYWGWWIAWAPFVGMFIARVSRGRTIREFIIGVLLVPVGFTFMWMTFFGNTALHMIMQEGYSGLTAAVSADTAVALFQFFEHLPLASITSLLATVLVITFFVTSSDSGSLVIDMLTSDGEDDSPLWQRVFWALAEGAVAATLLLSGGLTSLQTATIASALPFAMIMLLMCWGLLRALRKEVVKRISLREAMVMPKSPKSPVPWQKRLQTLVHFPKKQEVVRYIEHTVLPAMQDVAAELAKQQLSAQVRQEDNRIWLEVYHGAEVDFFYSVHLVPHTAPAFVMRDTQKPQHDALHYYRAEVHLREGGQDYDIMGWTQDQLISNILDQYEKHMHFLHLVR